MSRRHDEPLNGKSSLLGLPNELLLNVVSLLQAPEIDSLNASSLEEADLKFHTWAEDAIHEQRNVYRTRSTLLSLAYTCKRLYKLAHRSAWETIDITDRRRPSQETLNIIRRSNTIREAARTVYVTDEYAHCLSLIPKAECVTLLDEQVGGGTPSYAHFKPFSKKFRRLRLINAALHRHNLSDVFQCPEKLDQLWYHLGIYETFILERRNVWDPTAFVSALECQRHALRTLILTRTDEVLRNNSRQMNSLRVVPCDLSSLGALQHVRIAQIFLFGTGQLLHDTDVDLPRRLPQSLRTISVLYDDPAAVCFFSTPVHEMRWSRWPQWPKTVVQGNMSEQMLPHLSNVTVIELAGKDSRLRPNWPHMDRGMQAEDDEADDAFPQSSVNMEVKPPEYIDRLYSQSRTKLKVVLNVV